MPFEPDDASPPTPGFTPDSAPTPARPTPGFVVDPPLRQLNQQAPVGYERTETGLQPAGLVTPPEPDRTSIQEDARRLGEAVTSAPRKLGQKAIRAAEAVTDIPFVKLGSQVGMGNTSAVKDYAVQQGGPNYANEPQTAEPFAIPEHFDLPITEDVSARQALNIALDKTLGRSVRATQRIAGKPLAQMAYTGTKEAADVIDQGLAGNQLRTARNAQYNQPGATGRQPSGMEHVLPPSIEIQETPEMHEHNSKTLLKVLGGQEFYDPDNSPIKATAEQQMVQEYGETGSKVMEAALELGSQWPIMFLPGAEAKWASGGADATIEAALGAGPKALRAALPEAMDAAIAGPLKQGIASGATQGAYMAATKSGQDYAEQMGYGSLLGGVLGLAGGMWARRQLPKKLGAQLRAPQEHLPTLYGEAPVNAPPTNFTPIELHQGVPSIAPTEAPAVLLPPKTLQELVRQLDEAIASSAPVVRKGGTYVQPRNTKAQREVEGKKALAQLTPRAPVNPVESPEFSIDFRKPEPGERVVPTFSYRTIDADGNLVMRDVSVEAGPGRASTSKPKETVVEVKGKAGERRVTPQASAQSTAITASYKDTPITSAKHMRELEKGRYINYAAESDEVTSFLNDVDTHPDVQAIDDIVGGTPDYMAPETAGAFHSNELSKATPKARREAALREKALRPSDGPPTLAERKNLPVAMTVEPTGKVQVTPIAETQPRPSSTVSFKPGDLIQATGGGPKMLVEGIAPEGKILVRTGTGQLLEMPAQEFHLLSDPIERTNLRTELDKHYTRNGLNLGTPGDASPRLKAIIQANERITVPDVLRWEGHSPSDLAWAVGVLRNMEAKGLLKETGPGEFAPTRVRRPETPEMDPKARGGQFVYYDTGAMPSSGALAGDHPTGSGLWGVLRGPDSRRAGNWLIEVPDPTSITPDIRPDVIQRYGKTTYISVPEQEVRTKWPVRMADKSRVDPGIDMYGWTKPMPPGFVQTPGGNIKDTEALSRAWAQANKPGMIGQAKGVQQKMAQALIGAAHMSDPIIRASAGQRLFAAPHVMRSEALAMSNWLDAKLGGRGSGANTELTKALELHRAKGPAGTTAKTIDPAALQQWSLKYPKESAASLSDIKRLTGLNDQYSSILAQRGVDKVAYLEAKRANDHIPEYLTTNYAAFQMPRREWAEFAHKNLTEEWSNVVRWMTEQYPGRDPAAITQDLDAILRLDNPIKGFEDKGYLKAEAKAKLKERQDVPAPIRAILGEHKDASIKLAFTVAYKRQLVKGIQSWDAIAAQPGVWSPGVRPDMTLQVPDDPLFGNARNGYVNDNPSTRMLIEGRKLSHLGDSSSILRGMGWLGQKWKTGHTVYNQVAWVNNTIRNLKGVLLSGGYAGPDDMQGFRDAAAMLADYSRDPTIYGPNKLLVEAMDYDAVGPGLAGVELGAEQRKFQRKIFDYYRKTNANGWAQAYEGIRDAALAVPETTHQGYDSIDKVAKFGSYLNIRRKLIAQGMSMDDAAAVAALRINKRFPNFTQTPDWVKRTVAGGGNFSLLAPYATSKMEDVRVNGTLVTDIMSSLTPGPKGPAHDPELPFRVLALTAAVGGAATLALHTRRMNGISDDEDTRQRATIPLKSQKYSHFLIGSLDYDPQGRRVFYPVDSYEDMLMAFKGNLRDDALNRFLMGNLLDITGDDSFTGLGVQALSANLGTTTGQDIDMTPRADQTGALNMALKYGPQFLPQGPMTASKAVDRTAPSGRLINSEAWTPDQALVRGLGGQSPVPVGPQTRKQTLMETASGVKAAQKDVGAAALDAALQGASGERQKYMIQSNVRELKKRINIPRPLKSSGNTGGNK